MIAPCRFCNKQTYYECVKGKVMCPNCQKRRGEIAKVISNLLKLKQSKDRALFITSVSEMILIKELEVIK